MKKKIFSLYMKEVFCGFRFYAATAAITLLYAGVAYLHVFSGRSLDDMTAVMHEFGLSYLQGAVYILACLPLVLSFCDDCSNQYIRSIVVRSGIRRYTVSKFVVGTISAFVSHFAGLVLSLIIVSVGLNVPMPNGFAMYQDYAYFVKIGIPVMTILVKVFLLAIYGAMFACIGLAVGSVLPNKFIVLASPFAAYFALMEIPFSLHLPGCFDMLGLSTGGQMLHPNVGEDETLWLMFKNIFFVSGIALAFILISYIVFRILVKRRVNCKMGNI